MVDGGINEVREKDGSFTVGHNERELGERVLIKKVLDKLLEEILFFDIIILQRDRF